MRSAEPQPLVQPSGLSVLGQRRYSKILLLDGYSTRTLACVRSWGKRGIQFAVGGENRWDMSLHSRYCKDKFVYTSPKRSLERFIEDVNHYSQHFGVDGILPTSEAAIMACSKFQKHLKSPAIIPPAEHIELMFSKANAMKLAQLAGISCPKTLIVAPGGPLPAEVGNFAFPVVVKSESSELLAPNRAVTSGKTSYVSNREDLEREIRARLASGNAALLQEFIDGYGLGISGLFIEGRPVALLAHRRIRESDPLGGPSALAESVEIDPSLLEPTQALMKKIGFTGPAMIEYKVDRKTGRPYFMEINCRFWGTVLLAPAAGLDLPFLYWKLLNGMDLESDETKYRTGIRGRYLVGDTKCLLLCLRGKPKYWPGVFPRRWTAVKAYLASFFDKNTKDLLLTSEDPFPFFSRLIQDFA